MSGDTTPAVQPGGEILIYQAAEGDTRLEVRLEDETVWLSQQQMAELFQTTRANITLHIGNIYTEGELSPEGTCKNFLLVRQEGTRTVRRKVEHYNLDMIISLGYRVKSLIATQFRRWAISGYFDFAEVQAMRHNPMHMSDYAEHLDRVLAATGENALQGAGTVSHAQAREKAEREYRRYQANTLSPVEKAYLESIKSMEAEVKTLKGRKQ